MNRCKDCKYAQDSGYEIAGIECCTCSLTRRAMNANAESECNCYNRDLSGYDICYNCKYYIGGEDWGYFVHTVICTIIWTSFPMSLVNDMKGELMSDLISRQAAIDAIDRLDIPEDMCVFEILSHIELEIGNLPSAQPELPKQFMSDDCISRSELYKKVCEAEKLARERVLDTPSDSPFPNKLNPAYTRYSAQLNERIQFKHMIADARSVQPEQQWILCSERLPEVGTYVLVSKKPLSFRSNLPNVCMAHRSCDPRSGKEEWNDMLFGKLDDDDVLAWMPLPEPYREERIDE